MTKNVRGLGVTEIELGPQAYATGWVRNAFGVSGMLG